MSSKKKEEQLVRETETAEKFCKGKTCCHKGHLGNLLSCDYLLHTGERRPDRISLCEGYSRRIVQVNLETNEIEYFKNIDEASEKTNIPKSAILSCMKKEISDINGFTFKKEHFHQESFVNL